MSSAQGSCCRQQVVEGAHQSVNRAQHSTTPDGARPPARRAIVAIVAGAIVVVGTLWAWRTRSAVPAGDGPLVLISIDTLRADRLPAYGYKGTRTPQIDRLVADGVLFEQAYTHSPQTLPAHASILSGQLPFEHGVRDNVGFTVKEGQRFLPHVLHDGGFASGGFVSAYVLRHQTGIGQGFDLYDDALPAASPELPLGQVQRPGTLTVENANRWIDQRTSAKFFLFLHIYEPHRPYAPPARFKTSNPYDGEVEYTDEILGQLLDHLRTKGLYERATIVLLADHGEGLGDHGEDEHGIFLYRETIRVPLVIKLPGSRGAGRRVADPVQHIDVGPTLIDLAGLPIPEALGGRSLRPALEDAGTLPRASIYSEALSPRYHFGWSQLYALADERYRFIRAPRDELYDIAQDPGERRSIATERPQVRAAMRGAIEPLIAGAALQTPSTVSDADRQKLAALGYVGTQSTASLSLPGDQLPDPKDKVATLQEYKRATDLAGDRRYAEATAIFRRLLQTDPEMTDVWLQLAGMYERRGMIEAAVDAYKEIIKRNPKDPASLTGAAAGLLRLGKLDDARAHADLALTVAPAAAHELLARIAVERGDAEAARREAALVRATEADSPLPDFIEGLILYRQKQYAAAISHFLGARQKLSTRTVQMSDVDYYLADSSGRLERYEDAERYFLAEISHFPDNLRARAGLAMLYRSMGRDAEAERAINALVQQAPTREGYDLAAQLWTMFGETHRAAAARAQARRPPG